MVHRIISISMDENVAEKFDTLQECDGLSRSSRIEMLIRQELRNQNIPLH